MQVYRELRILTARPTPADEARAPARPLMASSAAPSPIRGWASDATRMRAECHRRAAAACPPSSSAARASTSRCCSRACRRCPADPTRIRARRRSRARRPSCKRSTRAGRPRSATARASPRPTRNASCVRSRSWTPPGDRCRTGRANPAAPVGRRQAQAAGLARPRVAVIGHRRPLRRHAGGGRAR